jgi:hypothetical protein
MKPRIAYNNLIESALSLTALYPDNDSSVTNVYHPYMEYALWCTQPTTTITGRWTTPQSISCMGLAYHNAITAVLTLYDSGGASLYSGTTTLEENDSIYYMTEVSSVYSFSLVITGPESVRIGYLFLGKCVELPLFSRGSEYPLTLQGTSDRTRGGQCYGLFARPVQGYSVSFPRFEPDDLVKMNEYIETVQNVKPHMVDLFPDSHSTVSPFYGIISTDSLDFAKRSESGFFYEVSFEWEEAR